MSVTIVTIAYKINVMLYMCSMLLYICRCIISSRISEHVTAFFCIKLMKMDTSNAAGYTLPEGTMVSKLKYGTKKCCYGKLMVKF